MKKANKQNRRKQTHEISKCKLYEKIKTSAVSDNKAATIFNENKRKKKIHIFVQCHRPFAKKKFAFIFYAKIEILT